MERDSRPEVNDLSQSSSSSRQNVDLSCQRESEPLPSFFDEFGSSKKHIVIQSEVRTEKILSEIMFKNVVQWINTDSSLSNALYTTIDKLQTTDSLCNVFNSSTQTSRQKAEYFDPGPSTSQAKPPISAVRFTDRQWFQNMAKFDSPSTSTELGDSSRRFCVPEFARPVLRQTRGESEPRVAKWQALNVQNSQSAPNRSNLQHQAQLRTVTDATKLKLREHLMKTASAKSTSLQMSPQPSAVPTSLQTTSPSTQKPSQTLPSSSTSSKTRPPPSEIPQFSCFPHLKVTTPPLNSLEMQLLLQTTIKMGVGYYNFTSNVNYNLCEPMMKMLLKEQPSNQSSSRSSQDSSADSTPLLSSSSSLDKVTEERPPTISDLQLDDFTAPDTIYRCGLKLAMKKTHLYSRRLQWNRIFFVPTELCPAVQTDAELALGFCVTYVRECGERWCKIRCHIESYICLHMYSCSCPQKKKIFGWCSHIHAATYCGLRRFSQDTVAFVPNTSGIMKIHHLRAKYKYMKLLKNWPADLMEKLDDLELRGTIKQLRTTCVCPKYKRCKECTACYCKYKCKCIDYKRLRFPCEHIHYIAMCTRQEPSTVLANEFRHYEYHTDDSGDETDTKASSVIEEQHQRSFCIKRRLIKQISENSWSVRSTRTHLKYQVTSTRNYNRKPGEQSRCPQCSGKQPFNWADCCVTCSICPHDFKCTCPKNKPDKKSICKHIHAVVRNFGQKRTRRRDFEKLLAPARTYSSSESEDSDSWIEVEL